MYGRGKFGIAYMEKTSFDQRMEGTDVSQWYRVDKDLLSNDLQSTFYHSKFDSDTKAFLDNSRALSDSVCLQLYYSLASACFGWFMTKTSINGLLSRGSMFLFSPAQLGPFLQVPLDWDASSKSVLDLGAGDGCITEALSIFYGKTFVTEASGPMRRRLTARGFSIVPTDSWDSGGPFDLISCLNLVDRIPTPLSFLRRLHNAAREQKAGVLLAVVFPWSQYVEFGSSRVPTESIRLSTRVFESQVSEFVEDVLRPIGFRVRRWTRLPYLCEGDAFQSFYKLYDALFLLDAD